MPLVVVVDTTPSGHGSGPCLPWPVVWSCTVPLSSAAVTGQAVQAASEILHALSGRQFGLCELTLRPCRDDCADEWAPWPGATWPTPALISGRWYNLACGLCGGFCSCTSFSQVTLPAPVHEILQVKVDGETLDPSAYRLDDARLLVRLDGEWPACNDLTLDDDQPGTWSVTATYGQPVPVLGELAVGELACEILRAVSGEDCRLPANVTQLVRQGVTIQMPDPAEAFKDGLVGLPLSDKFVLTYNRYRLPARSRVYSVDHPGHRRTG